jgi:putative ABC transport system permease protein
MSAGGTRMKPRGVLHLYRVRLRGRLVQESLAAVGIAVGVALLLASQIANASLKGSVSQLTSGVVGQSRLQIEARTPRGFSERLLREVQHLPGVRSAAPVLEVQTSVVGPSGARSVDLIGADPRFVGLGGELLQHLSAEALARQHAFALPAPIAQEVGATQLQNVTLQIGVRSEPALLGITLQESEIGTLIHSPIALAPLAYAQRLAGLPHRITRIFVRPQYGRDRQVLTALVKLADGRLNVEPADFDATLFNNAAEPTNESTSVFAIISALVGFLFALNAMLLTVPARRHLLDDLRLDGYGYQTVLEILLFDALVLGLLASSLGLLVGDELSRLLFHASPGYLSFAFPVGSQRIVTAQSILLAIGGGLLAALLGVLLPVHDLVLPWSRTALRPSQVERVRRWSIPLGGLACLAVTFEILLLSPEHAILGVVALTAALLLLLPSLIRGVLWLAARLTLDVRVRAPFVAVSELRAVSTWPRTVAIAATGAVAVFGSVSIEGTRRDLERGLDASAKGIDSQASIWVTPTASSDAFATTPFAGKASLRAIAHVAGVEAVRAYRGGFLDYDGRRVWVLAPPSAVVTPIARTQMVSGDFSLATARVRGSGWAVMSQALANQHHLHIGEAFTLPSPSPTRFRLAGLITNLGWPSGAIILNAEDYARAWGSRDVSADQIVLAQGANSASVVARIQRALGSRSGLIAVPSFRRERQHYEEASQGLSRLTAIRTLVLVASVLAMAAAIGSMVWQRRARLADLKFDGLSDLVVWRALLLESALLIGSGCSIGAIFGLGGQLLGSDAILSVTGFPVITSPAFVVAIASFLMVSIVAVTITAIPGYYVARVSPATALSE